MSEVATIPTILGNVLSSAKTEAAWAEDTRVLPYGYIAVSFDGNGVKRLKLGDGVKVWSELDFFESAAGGGKVYFYNRGTISGLGTFTKTANVGGSPYFRLNDDHILVQSYNYAAITIISTEKIDVTNLNTIYLCVQGTGSSSYVWNLILFFCDTRYTIDNDIDIHFQDYASWDGAPETYNDKTVLVPIDVSTVSGSYYFGIKSSFVGYAKIFEIYGEE